MTFLEWLVASLLHFTPRQASIDLVHLMSLKSRVMLWNSVSGIFNQCSSCFIGSRGQPPVSLLGLGFTLLCCHMRCFNKLEVVILRLKAFLLPAQSLQWRTMFLAWGVHVMVRQPTCSRTKIQLRSGNTVITYCSDCKTVIDLHLNPLQYLLPGKLMTVIHHIHVRVKLTKHFCSFGQMSFYGATKSTDRGQVWWMAQENISL